MVYEILIKLQLTEEVSFNLTIELPYGDAFNEYKQNRP